MKHLYKKSELTFSLVLVGLYVALFSIADNLSRSIGIEKILTAPLSVLFVAVLYVWIHKNGLLKRTQPIFFVRLTARQKTISILYRCS